MATKAGSPKAVQEGLKTFRDLFVEELEVQSLQGNLARVVSERVGLGSLTLELDPTALSALEKSRAILTLIPECQVRSYN